MQWYDYVMCFFGGAFLANFVPHFTRGICGSPFPTPFARPPGRGLSSPTVNVLWGTFNLLVSYALLRYGLFSLHSWPAVILALAGALVMGVQLSLAFRRVGQ
jgi:hypothetical protein